MKPSRNKQLSVFSLYFLCCSFYKRQLLVLCLRNPAGKECGWRETVQIRYRHKCRKRVTTHKAVNSSVFLYLLHKESWACIVNAEENPASELYRLQCSSPPWAHDSAAVCVETWLFLLLHAHGCACVCVPFLSIPHFVPIISKGMGPNTAIHTNIRATEATASENGGLVGAGGRQMERRQRMQTWGRGGGINTFSQNLIWVFPHLFVGLEEMFLAFVSKTLVTCQICCLVSQVDMPISHLQYIKEDIISK